MNYINNEEMPLGRLMANICRLQASRADQFMDRVGLYRGQAILLMILSDQDGLSHSEVAEKLKISPAATTKVIKRLEMLNYLQRRSDPADERLSRVFLREEGRAVIHQIHAVFEEINRLMFLGISPEEQSALRQILIRIMTNLQDIQEKTLD